MLRQYQSNNKKVTHHDLVGLACHATSDAEYRSCPKRMGIFLEGRANNLSQSWQLEVWA
jgi:hypothetical protein